MKIGVFGGTRGVGLQTIQQALHQGHEVTLLARNPQSVDSLSNEKI